MFNFLDLLTIDPNLLGGTTDGARGIPERQIIVRDRTEDTPDRQITSTPDLLQSSISPQKTNRIKEGIQCRPKDTENILDPR